MRLYITQIFSNHGQKVLCGILPLKLHTDGRVQLGFEAEEKTNRSLGTSNVYVMTGFELTAHILTVKGIPNLDSLPKESSGKDTPISEMAICFDEMPA